MSATTEAIDLVDNLVKAKIPKTTAKQLVDYADKQKDKAVNLQWVAIAILAAGMFAIFAILWETSQKVATKEDLKEVKEELKEVRADIKEIRKIILQKR